MASASAYVSGPDEGELRCGPGETCTWFKATGESTGGTFALVDECSRKGESVPLHFHKDDDESFYVLQGEITFYLSEKPGIRAGAGSFVHIPGGTTHGFRVESDAARYLILTTARHGMFYEAISRRVQSPGDAFEEVTGEEISKACREFGIEFVGELPADG